MATVKMTESVTNTVTNVPALMATLENRVRTQLVSLKD